MMVSRGDRPDHLGWPRDRAAQGLIGPEDFRGGVVGDTLGFVVVAGDFLEHDAAFPLDLLGREAELSTMSLTISWSILGRHMTVSGLQPLTTSRLLVTVDWLHRRKLSLQV
jgi:hypothetical protein